MATQKKSDKSRSNASASATGHRKAGVFDVARPGSGQVAASTTSKPVLISNRPVAQDPMVVSGGASSSSDEGPVEVPETAPILTPVKKKVIMPLSDMKADEAADSAPAEDGSVADQTAEVLPIDESPQTAPEQDEQAAPESERADEKVAVKTEIGNPVTMLEPATEAGVPKADREEKELSADQAIAAEKSAQEREAKLQEMIDEEKYFLPINAMQARRTRNFVLVGLLVIIILAVAWYNIALDAGLLPNQFNVPHTSFFTIK